MSYILWRFKYLKESLVACQILFAKFIRIFTKYELQKFATVKGFVNFSLSVTVRDGVSPIPSNKYVINHVPGSTASSTSTELLCIVELSVSQFLTNTT